MNTNVHFLSLMMQVYNIFPCMVGGWADFTPQGDQLPLWAVLAISEMWFGGTWDPNTLTPTVYNQDGWNLLVVQQWSHRGNFVPWEYVTVSGDIFVCYNWIVTGTRVAPGTYWVEARAAAKHAAEHKTKNCPAPSINGVEAEKSCCSECRVKLLV